MPTLTNASKGDLTLPALTDPDTNLVTKAVFIPAGKSIEIDEETLASLKKNDAINRLFLPNLLAGQAEPKRPEPVDPKPTEEKSEEVAENVTPPTLKKERK